MWFWNRIEIYSGYSMQEFNEERAVLSSKGVK